MQTLYLSERNLKILLSKLERKKAGEETACAIIKYQNKNDPFVNTMKEVKVVAVSDKEFYTNRAAGMMLQIDEDRIK